MGKEEKPPFRLEAGEECLLGGRVLTLEGEYGFLFGRDELAVLLFHSGLQRRLEGTAPALNEVRKRGLALLCVDLGLDRIAALDNCGDVRPATVTALLANCWCFLNSARHAASSRVNLSTARCKWSRCPTTSLYASQGTSNSRFNGSTRSFGLADLVGDAIIFCLRFGGVSEAEVSIFRGGPAFGVSCDDFSGAKVVGEDGLPEALVED